jgi:hypothetical protein
MHVGQFLDLFLLLGGQAGHEVLVVSLSRTAAFVSLGPDSEDEDQKEGEDEMSCVHECSCHTVEVVV